MRMGTAELHASVPAFEAQTSRADGHHALFLLRARKVAWVHCVPAVSSLAVARLAVRDGVSLDRVRAPERIRTRGGLSWGGRVGTRRYRARLPMTIERNPHNSERPALRRHATPLTWDI